MNVIIIVIALVCIVAVVLIWAKRQASGVNDYFCNAVKVWIFMIKEDAKIAAIAAAKVAGEKQRESMLNYLSGMASDLERGFPDDPVMRRHSRRLLSLREEIAAKNWTMLDAAEEKNRLFEINPDYLKALNKADAKIFVRQYPDFFKSGTDDRR
jgi:ribonuclease HII